MIIPITIEIIKKEKWYIARAVELDFISQGDSPEEAKRNLYEVIDIQFEEMKELGTLKEYLEECGFSIGDDTKYPEFVSLEKSEVSLECL
jgi:predicted RNase H-like HicB family nuclease